MHKYSVFLLLILISSCASQYQTSFGESRPKNAKFRLKPDINDLRQFDTIEFTAKQVFQRFSETLSEGYSRWLLILGEDGRFCSYADSVSERQSDFVVLKDNLWKSSPQVGFYSLKNDTLVIEYFFNLQWGEYYEMHGVIDKNGGYSVFQTYQGRPSIYRKKYKSSKRGRIKKAKINSKGRDYFERANFR